MPPLPQTKFLHSAERPEQRAALPPLPEVALCGRSNVGKSSLLNALCGKGLARVSKTPGRTQLINTFSVNGLFYLVDLPGYGFQKGVGRDKARQWGQVIPQYLGDNPNLKLALVLADFRLPPQSADADLCAWLTKQGIPFGVVGTKCDDVPRHAWHKRVLDLAFACRLDLASMVFPVSARNGHGLDELAAAMLEVVTEGAEE